ncbi:MAG: nucleotidyl transferase AbiEii/AbiGii toxin family protein [Nanoarchaeota archaeon]
MDEEKALRVEDFKQIVLEQGFNEEILTKDYYLMRTLFLLKDVKSVYFKGGTALQKILLHHARLSEDIDYTLTRDIKLVIAEIRPILEKSGLFEKITNDKDVEGFTRLVAHYYGFTGKPDTLFLDLNERGKLLTPPEKHSIEHFYNRFIPNFSVKTLSIEEMVAEMVAAAIGRNRPRDHYDIYQIIKHKIPINMKLVEKKCKESGDEFSIIRMFNNAKKLKNRWDTDMIPLIKDEVTFHEVMQTLATYFKLKKEKERLKTR